jgi:hypothetical protein
MAGGSFAVHGRLGTNDLGVLRTAALAGLGIAHVPLSLVARSWPPASSSTCWPRGGAPVGRPPRGLPGRRTPGARQGRFRGSRGGVLRAARPPEPRAVRAQGSWQARTCLNSAALSPGSKPIAPGDRDAALRPP